MEFVVVVSHGLDSLSTEKGLVSEDYIRKYSKKYNFDSYAGPYSSDSSRENQILPN